MNGGDTMEVKGTCVVCGEFVDWGIIIDEFKDLLDQVDMYGPDSLTENEQVVWEGMCCSTVCYDELD